MPLQKSLVHKGNQCLPVLGIILEFAQVPLVGRHRRQQQVSDLHSGLYSLDMFACNLEDWKCREKTLTTQAKMSQTRPFARPSSRTSPA